MTRAGAEVEVEVALGSDRSLLKFKEPLGLERLLAAEAPTQAKLS
jgi:hypothetical protein